MTLEELLEKDPYSLGKEDKHKVLDAFLTDLTRHHYAHCEAYRKMLDATGVDIDKIRHYEDLPYLPVRLFKELTLRSVEEDAVIKTMTSSATTGQQVSRIYLDRETSADQTRTLVRIVSSLLGSKRVPMIILDSRDVVKDRNMFSARGAGILGFSMFGSKRMYALDEQMELDVAGMKAFLEEHKGETIFLFGFTFMIWQHFYKKLKETGYCPDLSKGVLVHGGGWKKLVAESVSTARFKQALNDVCGIRPENVHDYYGMVEQTGTIYLECEHGHLHASNFSDIIIRNPKDFSVAGNGEPGIVEVVSVLPKSYPGHVLLTEDEGVVLGEDDCPCGRKGKYFHIHGRIRNAEIRGCSDTYAAKFGKLSGLEYVIGDDRTLEEMPHVSALPPFATPVINFFDDLSKLLMRKGRAYSDVMTFGFWCRKGALMQEKANYMDLERRLGRGIVFHSTPSNVPVNCAFSFAAGLLAGNANIVRLPAKDFPQVQIICDCVRELLETMHKDLAPYICFVKYPPIKEITDLFSGLCQSRVVWGGDATIAEIRQSPLPPRANEVTFADRYSFAIINGDTFLAAVDQDRVVRDFYNDTYYSDQNACTAPRLVVWLGEKKAEARQCFWKKVLEYVRAHYSIAPVQTVGKMNALYKAVSSVESGRVTVDLPWLVRIQVEKLDPVLMDYRFNSGFFYEYDAGSLADILPIATIKSQTVTYYGLTRKEIVRFVNEDHPQGVDRFVPLGKSMDFTLVWDGCDLITTLSRIVDIE